jgi:hypothetical protein
VPNDSTTELSIIQISVDPSSSSSTNNMQSPTDLPADIAATSFAWKDQF